MMKTAQDWLGRDKTVALNGSVVGCVFLQREVRPVIVVVVGVSLENPVGNHHSDVNLMSVVSQKAKSAIAPKTPLIP